MTRHVRSRLDIAFGRALTVGQTWRCACCRIEWKVRQVHRADCVAELVSAGHVREFRFEELRKHWEHVEAGRASQKAAA